ncbi:thymidylate kinase [Limimonas halophila]|uniref:Thymidylate kinase n=1 Tax=Limimonas halophila TaxID=1082479 RepID=A0A1G7NKU3_9PROT|nr:dTMP kinase [Limimonas halophila]SDF74527.1 thymidylate kinase [Limimonas halophila]
MTAGAFITFEGGEGAGKSLQVRRLAEWLRARGMDVLATREPGGCPASEAVRGLLVDGTHTWSPAGEAFLHCAARAEHVRTAIAPALAAGTWVVSDRFADSTVAYQGYGHALDTSFLRQASGHATGGTGPHLTLVLDVPPDVGLTRTRARGEENPYETLPMAFHERVRAGFLEIAAAEPDRCRVIDARADAETVHRHVVAAVNDRFGLSH